MPEAVQPYVSPMALWTRLGGKNTTVESDLVAWIQGPVRRAFFHHFTTYLQLLKEPSAVTMKESRLTEYVQYRRDNDPARPLLQRLFGVEWTEHMLHEVLFPPDSVLDATEL
jgi:phycoerythrobilin:ferredoxin oxidoreductase